MSANSVYNGHNSLYFINPYPYVYAQQIRLTALLVICVCMLFDERDSLLPKRYKQNSNVSSEFVDPQLRLFQCLETLKFCLNIFYIADIMMSSLRNHIVLESKNVCVMNHACI